MNQATITAPWETSLAEFLGRLSAAQDELLDLLDRKQRLLRAGDIAGLASLQLPESQLVERLQALLDQRASLLAQAEDLGLPHGSVRQLTLALPRAQRAALARQVDEASTRARILRHHGLTQWVVVQRSLLHLAQLLEIIATGGRTQPTYGSAPVSANNGTLVDQAA
jgi:flagellar biosynthesis/type III secretory pathway chaperone